MPLCESSSYFPVQSLNASTAFTFLAKPSKDACSLSSMPLQLPGSLDPGLECSQSYGHASPGSEQRKKPDRRASRDDTRSINMLSAAQLDCKRANN